MQAIAFLAHRKNESPAEADDSLEFSLLNELETIRPA